MITPFASHILQSSAENLCFAHTFAGARLLEPIERPQHTQFIERRIAGKRLVDAPTRPRHVMGNVACREFTQAFPCPSPSYPAEEQEWIEWSLRKWTKSGETHSTDQNHLCESRYNRHIFCSGKIPPANQTVAVWQMDIPRVPDGFPPQTLLQLIQREKKLIREQRENRTLLCQLVRDYELRREEQPSESASLSEWNDILLKHNLPREVDFLRFISPKKSDEQEEGFEPEENTFHSERSSDDERVSGSEFDHINNSGVRETTEGVPNRERWLEPRRFIFNPQGKTWSEVSAEDVADVTGSPDFTQTAGEYAIEFSGSMVKEVAEQLGLKPNTLTKRISRQELVRMYHGVDFSQTMGKYFCIITLNGINHLKILGKAEAPLSEVLAKFLDEWEKSETNAVKQTRKTGKKSGADQPTIGEREREAVKRIRYAYETVIGVFVPDEEGIGATYRCYFGHQELIRVLAEECDVTLSI
jgi:hypothetical protein